MSESLKGVTLWRGISSSNMDVSHDVMVSAMMTWCQPSLSAPSCLFNVEETVCVTPGQHRCGLHASSLAG